MSISGAILSLDLTQPVSDADDVSSLIGATTDRDNVGTSTMDTLANDQATYIAFDRPAQGKTFLIHSIYPAYQIYAVSVRHTGYTSNIDRIWYRMNPGGVFMNRVTDPSQSGTSDVVLDSETYREE